ncbi:hypothetical protein [Leisingera sp. MMG026]|uniref:hypothetical protein n=1 Tax=Leisingera sp. MMG026 TaxID=2909982 RepID=UPI001F40FFBB|nr:hypothetical protein [Leisingera sp. MMG026]MCF6433770.1 hypothetical protein [Leisingera sp. MMG026]
MDGQGLQPRIKEREIDDLFAKAFQTSPELCDRVRECLDLTGSGTAKQVGTQQGHFGDSGTIDLDVVLSGNRLLIENKISAYWSHVNGVAQPERYIRSGTGYCGTTVLLAPRSYLRKSVKASMFDKTLSYESLLSAFSGSDYDLLAAAIDQAEVPPENPSDVQTAFFQSFGALRAEIAPQITEKKRDRNKGSHTVHLDVPKSLTLHVGLPKPKVFLQFVEANVKLMIPKWGWHVTEIQRTGGLENTGIMLRQVGRVGTLALQLPTPTINCKGPFEPERERVVGAILTTARLCSWWDNNPDVLRH